MPADAFIDCNGVTVYQGTPLYARLLKEGKVRGDENPLDEAHILFGDGFTPQKLDAIISAHDETHRQW